MIKITKYYAGQDWTDKENLTYAAIGAAMDLAFDLSDWYALIETAAVLL